MARKRNELAQHRLPNLESVHTGSRFTVHAGIQRHGSTTAFILNIARLVGCLALLCASVAKLLTWTKESWHKGWYWMLRDPEIYITCTYLYALVLASVGLLSRRRGPLASSYLTWLLLTNVCVFGYRDVWPLATFNQEPADMSEGFFLWIKLGVLASTALLPPLFLI
ncbi:hypothetical protein CPB83DRAFT_887951 [Crepidotus variabilis]|uniref:Uncharacterized protein n=1 Tax=Crepidotus variabilis TaxID=179855 RepID=A0A9P6BDZ4_9AGAR|nr:hypothetical protein CPB83DRAFT_887951 [Crepidotus variabilis]